LLLHDDSTVGVTFIVVVVVVVIIIVIVIVTFTDNRRLPTHDLHLHSGRCGAAGRDGCSSGTNLCARRHRYRCTCGGDRCRSTRRSNGPRGTSARRDSGATRGVTARTRCGVRQWQCSAIVVVIIIIIIIIIVLEVVLLVTLLVLAVKLLAGARGVRARRCVRGCRGPLKRSHEVHDDGHLAGDVAQLPLRKQLQQKHASSHKPRVTQAQAHSFTPGQPCAGATRTAP
jgi:uncharacterized membrane protein